jgi:hypothetical protein
MAPGGTSEANNGVMVHFTRCRALWAAKGPGFGESSSERTLLVVVVVVVVVIEYPHDYDHDNDNDLKVFSTLCTAIAPWGPVTI